jgi:hypothetical protein
MVLTNLMSTEEELSVIRANNIHSARGKPKVSLFFGDEAAFFKLRDDSIVRTVGERYIGKSDSWVIWVSTAGEQPSGFFTTLCKNLPKESRRQYMKDSISMLKQVLKKIRKQRAQSSHQGS